VGRPRPTEFSSVGLTAIDKLPVPGPVEVRDPGDLAAGSGLAGDQVCDRRFHGGSDQAVYAYAREDLDAWEYELGRPLPDGIFGENLTTVGLDVTGALIGERWRVGERCVLEVSAPRIPCRTFAAWLAEQNWMRRFTERAQPGAYLRVITAGAVCAGDPVAVVRRPEHDVTIRLAFRSMTTRSELLDRIAAAEPALSATLRRRVQRRAARTP
jgi:MOSC domain-containing protein YiiM